MEYVAGRVLTDERLPGVAPKERTAIWTSAVQVLAALHHVIGLLLSVRRHRDDRHIHGHGHCHDEGGGAPHGGGGLGALHGAGSVSAHVPGGDHLELESLNLINSVLPLLPEAHDAVLGTEPLLRRAARRLWLTVASRRAAGEPTADGERWQLAMAPTLQALCGAGRDMTAGPVGADRAGCAERPRA